LSNNNPSGDEERLDKPSRLRRTRSASTTVPINNQIKSKLNSSRRRKSYSSIGSTDDSNNSEKTPINNHEKVI
jgi:hypothetical protein